MKVYVIQAENPDLYFHYYSYTLYMYIHKKNTIQNTASERVAIKQFNIQLSLRPSYVR